MKKIAYLVLTLLLFASCNEEEQANPGTLTIDFQHIANNDFLALGTSFTSSQGEQITINELKYIISNITLTRKNGTTYTYPVEESFFLINEADADSKRIVLQDIPAGAYVSISFGFGVDSSRYPIESGTLNFVPTAEEAGMLWSWSAGYKFIKLEGDFIPEAGGAETPFIVHVGSHGATLDNYREISVGLGDDIADTDFKIEEGLNAQQAVFFNVGNVWDGLNLIRIEDKPDIQVDPVNAPKIADNIQLSFFIIQG